MNSDSSAKEAERRCKYPGCNALLRKGSKGKYCDIHRELFEEERKKNSASSDHKIDVNRTLGDSEFLTLLEAAFILHYSTRSLRKMIKEGKINARRIGKRGRWMVPKEEVERFKNEGPGFLRPSHELLSADDVRQHDIAIFQKGDSIMSEAKVRELLWQLKHEQRYSASDFSMILDFLYFFDLRGNNYIDEKLRNALDKLHSGFEELISFMHINFEVLKRRSLFQDEIRILGYHPSVHGIERIKEYEEQDKELNQVIESAEVTYNKYRDAVKVVLGI